MQEAPNIDYIKTLSGDDVAFEQKFIGILKDEFPEESQDYANHMAKQELKMAAELVHKLKHKFNILGMEVAYKFAVRYEEELLTGDTKGDDDFRKFLNTIKDYLITL